MFSLSFDESADKLGPSFLCIHVRYIRQNKMEHKILALKEIKESSTGASLYEIVNEEIFSHLSKNDLKKTLLGL